MQWFKHDTNSTMDFKIKKLIIKYGAIGYAIYFHCLELIASEISDNNITFELEHDSEIIADDLRIKGNEQQSGKDLVEEIMRYMISLNLFEESEGHIFCFKLLKRLDTSMTSSAKLRSLISKAKNQESFLELQDERKQENHDTVMIYQDSSCKTRKEKNRIDKNRQDNNSEKKTKYTCKESLELCDLLVNYCKRDNPNFKTNNRDKWTDEIGKIHFLDNYEWEDIKSVIDYAKNDQFWNCNILSGEKLRKQMGQLFLKAKNNRKQNNATKREQLTDEEYRAMSDNPAEIPY